MSNPRFLDEPRKKEGNVKVGRVNLPRIPVMDDGDDTDANGDDNDLDVLNPGIDKDGRVGQFSERSRFNPLIDGLNDAVGIYEGV